MSHREKEDVKDNATDDFNTQMDAEHPERIKSDE